MADLYANNDLVSPDLAERLAKLGLKWEPRIGDWGSQDSLLGLIFEIEHSPDGVRLHTFFPDFVRVRKGLDWDWADELLWLPRRIDCERKLTERRYGYRESYCEDVYTFTAWPLGEVSDPAANAIQADGLTAAEAVGLVLEQAMKE